MKTRVAVFAGALVAVLLTASIPAYADHYVGTQPPRIEPGGHKLAKLTSAGVAPRVSTIGDMQPGSALGSAGVADPGDPGAPPGALGSLARTGLDALQLATLAVIMIGTGLILGRRARANRAL